MQLGTLWGAVTFLVGVGGLVTFSYKAWCVLHKPSKVLEHQVLTWVFGVSLFVVGASLIFVFLILPSSLVDFSKTSPVAAKGTDTTPLVAPIIKVADTPTKNPKPPSNQGKSGDTKVPLSPAGLKPDSMPKNLHEKEKAEAKPKIQQESDKEKEMAKIQLDLEKEKAKIQLDFEREKAKIQLDAERAIAAKKANDPHQPAKVHTSPNVAQPAKGQTPYGGQPNMGQGGNGTVLIVSPVPIPTGTLAYVSVDKGHLGRWGQWAVGTATYEFSAESGTRLIEVFTTKPQVQIIGSFTVKIQPRKRSVIKLAK